MNNCRFLDDKYYWCFHLNLHLVQAYIGYVHSFLHVLMIFSQFPLRSYDFPIVFLMFRWFFPSFSLDVHHKKPLPVPSGPWLGSLGPLPLGQFLSSWLRPRPCPQWEVKICRNQTKTMGKPRKIVISLGKTPIEPRKRRIFQIEDGILSWLYQE